MTIAVDLGRKARKQTKQMKDRKHIERNFHSVAWVMPQGWDLSVLGNKNFSVGICDGTPSTARSSFMVCASIRGDNP